LVIGGKFTAVISRTLMHLDNMSEEDEESLLHVVGAIEAKNKLKALMADIK